MLGVGGWGSFSHAGWWQGEGENVKHIGAHRRTHREGRDIHAFHCHTHAWECHASIWQTANHHPTHPTMPVCPGKAVIASPRLSPTDLCLLSHVCAMPAACPHVFHMHMHTSPCLSPTSIPQCTCPLSFSHSLGWQWSVMPVSWQVGGKCEGGGRCEMREVGEGGEEVER